MKIEKKQLKKQLREIEFLFSQSAKGLHHLFDDKARIANILSAPAREKNFFNSRNMKKIQNILQSLCREKPFRTKKTTSASSIQKILRFWSGLTFIL